MKKKNTCNYAGYGFDASRVSAKGLFNFFLRYDDEERIRNMVLDIIGEGKDISVLTDEEYSLVRDELRDWLEEDGGTVADYIAGTINGEERSLGRMYRQDVVTVCGAFVVFEPVMFPRDSEERTKRIRTKEDLIVMIRDYFPDEQIEFGLVFDGPEFTDCFWIKPDR